MKILICDDEHTYLNALRTHVEEYMENRHIPCSITALVDPSKVTETDTVFDLAFLDIQMPGVDGITLAKQLRQRNPKLALFFVTNYDEYQDDAMDLQAFRFFEKPFNANRLYAGLDKAMEYIDGAYIDIYLSDDGAQQTAVRRRTNLKKSRLPIKPTLTIPPDLMTSTPRWAAPVEIPKSRRQPQRKVAGFRSTRRIPCLPP